jgi:hypothetical protein
MLAAGGTVMFRGRAADRLSEGLPRSPVLGFTERPYRAMTTECGVERRSYPASLYRPAFMSHFSGGH